MNYRLTATPTKKQLLWGLIYLPVDLLLLPLMMSLVVFLLRRLMPLSFTQAQYNGVYFSVNFLAMVLIFRKFLLQEFYRCIQRFGHVLKTAGSGFLVYMVANFLMNLIILNLSPGLDNVNDAAIAQMAASDYWIIFLGTIVLVPITEELLFRGVLFGGLYNRSPVAAYAVSVLVFSAVHVVGYIGQYPATTLLLCLLQYIVPSLCLCWSYAKSDNFLTPVIIHTLVNAFGVLTMR